MTSFLSKDLKDVIELVVWIYRENFLEGLHNFLFINYLKGSDMSMTELDSKVKFLYFLSVFESVLSTRKFALYYTL